MQTIAVATNTSYPYFNLDYYKALKNLAREESRSFSSLHSWKNIRERLKGIPGTRPESVNSVIVDTVRGGLAIEMIRWGCIMRVPIAMVDFGSPREFWEVAQKIAEEEGGADLLSLVLQEGETVASARQQAIKVASEKYKPEGFLLTEPEKYLLLAFREVPQLHRGSLTVINRREDLFHALYPTDQRFTEITANINITDRLRNLGYWKSEDTIDFMFGVRVVPNDPDILGLFLNTALPNYLGEGSWGAHRYNHLMLPVIDCLKRELPVEVVEVNYLHPPIQSAIEFLDPEIAPIYGKRRAEQMRVVMTECLRHLGYREDYVRDFVSFLGETVRELGGPRVEISRMWRGGRER